MSMIDNINLNSFRMVRLYYFCNRWYDPRVGRFVSEDPIRFAGLSWNLYEYSKNNPIFYKDPLGLICVPWFDKPISNWEDIKILKDWIESTVVTFTPLSINVKCIWIKYEKIFQRRTVWKREWCFGIEKDSCGRMRFYSYFKILGQFYEYREYKRIMDVDESKGFIYSSGYDITQGNTACCPNPFKGWRWECITKKY